MIEKETLLILGAGASRPYGYPTARELVFGLQKALANETIRVGPVLREIGFAWKDVAAFRDELIASGQPSVDAFLAHRAEFAEVGKAAMGAYLLHCEERSPLIPTEDDDNQDRWYGRLFREINETDIKAWANLTIITFNYDRSLETSLVRFMTSSYRWDEAKAVANLKRMSFHHFYGRLADYQEPFSYGAGATATNVKHAMKGIRIPNDDKQDDEQANAILAAGAAQRICFLGFGYLAMNLDRLQIEPEHKKTYKRTFLGTAMGLGVNETAIVTRRISDFMSLGRREEGIIEFMKNHPVLG